VHGDFLTTFGTRKRLRAARVNRCFLAPQNLHKKNFAPAKKGRFWKSSVKQTPLQPGIVKTPLEIFK
jgi:hypothetical protein